MCVAESFVLMRLLIFVANIVQAFDVFTRKKASSFTQSNHLQEVKPSNVIK